MTGREIVVWRPQPRNVYCMDCLTLLQQCAPQSINAIIADPPYNLTNLAFEQAIDWPAFWKQARRVLVSERAPVILFSQQPFTTDLINSNRAGFRYEIIWEKNNPTGFLSAKRRPLSCHENILIFADKAANYAPQMEAGGIAKTIRRAGKAGHYGSHTRKTSTSTGMLYPRSVWRIGMKYDSLSTGGAKDSLHPTAKPLPLMERLILTYTAPGDLVLDPFAGSGSTGVAARATGRRFVMGELDAKYVAVARERLSHGFTLPMFETIAATESESA